MQIRVTERTGFDGGDMRKRDHLEDLEVDGEQY
jgi:hypothetical protein